MKKGMLIQILSLLVLSGCCLIACKDNKISTPEPRPVKAIVVGAEQSLSGREFPGRAKPVQEVNLSFRVGGTLSFLPIKIGDQVTKDQVLARLDPLEFEAKLKAAQAEKTRDEQNFNRAKQLIIKGNISQSDYDLLQAKLLITQANLDLAEKALADSIIKAPFAGRIASVSAENYQSVTANQTIARLLDTSNIEMVVQIPENLISAVPYATEIKVKFDAFPNHLIPAKIKEISNEASADTRTYPVTLSMEQPKDVEILPGMAGKVTGKVVYPNQKNTQQLTIPESAVFTPSPGSKTFVWVLDEKTHKVHRKPVTLGDLTATGIAIKEGLTPGDWVVIAGVHSLQEGQEVTLLNQESE